MLLNSDLGRVRTYVGSDGKLHFVNSAGADTVLPFSNVLGYVATKEWYSGDISATHTISSEKYVAVISACISDGYIPILSASLSSGKLNLLHKEGNSNKTGISVYVYDIDTVQQTILSMMFDHANVAFMVLFKK